MASGKKAKRLRRQIFGVGKEAKKVFRDRQYANAPKDGKLVSDPQRRIYQRMKKATKGINIGS